MKKDKKIKLPIGKPENWIELIRQLGGTVCVDPAPPTKPFSDWIPFFKKRGNRKK